MSLINPKTARFGLILGTVSCSMRSAVLTFLYDSKKELISEISYMHGVTPKLVNQKEKLLCRNSFLLHCLLKSF